MADKLPKTPEMIAAEQTGGETFTPTAQPAITGLAVQTPTEGTDADTTTTDANSTDTTSGDETPTQPTSDDVATAITPTEPVQNTTSGPVPTAPQLGGFTETTAGNEVPDPAKVIVVADSGQDAATRAHNLGGDETKAPAAPVGTLVVQKTIDELEDEIDSGDFKDITEFVKKHWDARDANVDKMAQVLRMKTVEIWQILKDDLGVQTPNGL